MFFVISGYVITYSAESNLKKQNSPFVFLKARFLRIYPAFWASILVVLLTPFVIEFISSFKSGEFISPSNLLLKYTLLEWFHFVALTKVFFATSSDLQSQFNAINSVYWTLAIEFQFYCMVFVALWFRKRYHQIIIGVTVVAFLNMMFPSPFNYGFFIHHWPAFSLGIGLAYLHKKGFTFSSMFTGKFARLVAVLCSIGFTIYFANVTGPGKIFFAASFGLLIWVISDFEKMLRKVKESPNKLVYWLLEVWLILGAMSYSVYLLHGKLYFLPNIFVRQVFDKDNLLFGMLTILGTLFLCYPFYYFVERRFLSKNYQKIQQTVLSKPPANHP